MTEYDEVVHVETLEEYLAVLDKWFDKGYDWSTTLRSQDHHEEYFTKRRGRYLILDEGDISYSAGKHVRDENLKVTPFKEFMAKEQGVTPWVPAPEDIPEREVTYDVSVEQMAFLNDARDSGYPASYLMVHSKEYGEVLDAVVGYGATFERDILRYVAGDDSVVFKVKDPLFMLKGKDSDGDTVYFTRGLYPPSYTYDKEDAFTASHEEITCWNTPFWEIVLVDA